MFQLALQRLHGAFQEGLVVINVIVLGPDQQFIGSDPLQQKFNALCEKREASYWLWDGVHPTAAGHEVIARQWVKAYATLNVI